MSDNATEAKQTRLQVEDVTDELIKPVVNADPSILQECDDYLNDLAQSKGYIIDYLDRASYTIDDIPNPMPYKVKQLAVMWVCREVCSRKAGAAGASYRNQETGDKWSTKLNYFQKQVTALESQITPEVLLGIVTSFSVGQITLERG